MLERLIMEEPFVHTYYFVCLNCRMDKALYIYIIQTSLDAENYMHSTIWKQIPYFKVCTGIKFYLVNCEMVRMLVFCTKKHH
ncbi:hypothetical protein FKM82_005982 [Ascaphus truei]